MAQVATRKRGVSKPVQAVDSVRAHGSVLRGRFAAPQDEGDGSYELPFRLKRQKSAMPTLLQQFWRRPNLFNGLGAKICHTIKFGLSFLVLSSTSPVSSRAGEGLAPFMTAWMCSPRPLGWDKGPRAQEARTGGNLSLPPGANARRQVRAARNAGGDRSASNSPNRFRIL
jgi:hypothetical protein